MAHGVLLNPPEADSGIVGPVRSTVQLVTLFCEGRIPSYLLLAFLAIRGGSVADFGLPVGYRTAVLLMQGGRSQRRRQDGSNRLATTV